MYTTIIHPIRKALNLSMIEYCVLEAVRGWSKTKYGGHCKLSLRRTADYFDVSHQSVKRAKDALVMKGLIEYDKEYEMYSVADWYINIISGNADINLIAQDKAHTLIYGAVPEQYKDKYKHLKESVTGVTKCDSECNNILQGVTKCDKSVTKCDTYTYNTNKITNRDTNNKESFPDLNHYSEAVEQPLQSGVNDLDFSEWFKLYDKGVGKNKAFDYWCIHISPLNHKQLQQIFDHTKKYVATTPKRFRKSPLNYLFDETWLDEIIDRGKPIDKKEFQDYVSNQMKELGLAADKSKLKDFLKGYYTANEKYGWNMSDWKEHVMLTLDKEKLLYKSA